jgi:hypothetical protein
VGFDQLFIHTLGYNFYTLVVQPHAIVDGPVIFQESDTGAVGVPLPKMAGGGAYGNASKTHVGVILDAKRRLVGSGGQDNGAPEIKGIAVVRKSNDPFQGLAQVRTASHKGNKRCKPRRILEGVVPELRGLVENPTNQRQDLVTELQIILVIRALKSHIS